MAKNYKRTTDHREIETWVKAHNGRPVVLDLTVSDESDGNLTIAFDGTEGLDSVWRDFFDRFDTQGLVFHYSDEVEKGRESESFNILSAENNPPDHESFKNVVEPPDDELRTDENRFSSLPDQEENE